MTRNCWEGGAGGGNNQEGRYHSGPVLPGPLGGRPEPLGGRPELSRLNLSFHGRYHPPQTFPPTSPESPKGVWRIRALKASWEAWTSNCVFDRPRVCFKENSVRRKSCFLFDFRLCWVCFPCPLALSGLGSTGCQVCVRTWLWLWRR